MLTMGLTYRYMIFDDSSTAFHVQAWSLGLPLFSLQVLVKLSCLCFQRTTPANGFPNLLSNQLLVLQVLALMDICENRRTILTKKPPIRGYSTRLGSSKGNDNARVAAGYQILLAESIVWLEQDFASKCNNAIVESEDEDGKCIGEV